ncbi:MAG: adenylosuccinate synthetase, partial [Desulfamplus sp.]|nr:adenylosuccinate synthetase [Desulfamplus sp.]
FSNFGSGTLQGASSYFSQFCTIDPVGIVNELQLLLKKGVEPKLFIDAKCPVTTPYDIRYNQENHLHGTCGVGVGDTINREENHYSLTFGDLFYPWVLETRLALIKNFYQSCTEVSLDDFLDCCKIITNSNFIEKSSGVPEGNYSDYIYEGSQGLLLDQKYGFFPYVTRSNTGSINPAILSDNKKLEIYVITRAYQTRHGKGPMSNEFLPHNISINPLETNITNRFQGNFRRALLDLTLIEYAINRDDIIRTTHDKHLVITCMDHIIGEYRFSWQGEIIYCNNEFDFTQNVAQLLGFNSVYTSASDDGDKIKRLFFMDNSGK